MTKYLKIFFSLLMCFTVLSCGLVKHIEIPVQTVEKIVYKDTLIYIQDSIKVEVPYEVIKEVLPSIDTSYIKTSVAESIAYVDTAKKKLHHTLTQKGDIKAKYDTIIKVQYVNKIIEKDKPIPVEVIKYKRDALFWVLAVWALICLFMVLIKLFVIK